MADKEVFLEWCRGRSIWISDSIQFTQDESGSFACKVKPQDYCEENELVSAIPKSSIFSTKTSSLSHLLPSSSTLCGQALSQLSSSPSSISGLELSFHLLYEFTLGQESPFYGYLQSLPSRLDLPLSWKQTQDPGLTEAWQWLIGTEVERSLKRSESSRNPFHGMCLSRLEEYFFGTIIPTFNSLNVTSNLTASNYSIKLPNQERNHTLWTLFIHSYSMVSSRAFVVDTFHCLALVPIADLFNHADSSQHNIQFESESLVCVECGALPGSNCFNLSNHKQRRKGQGSEDGYKDESMRSINHFNLMDTLDMRTTSAIDGGEECFNNYGYSLNNAQLLLQYGFVLDVGTENERFGWDWYDEKGERAEMIESILASRSNTNFGSGYEDFEKIWMGCIDRFIKERKSNAPNPSTSIKLPPDNHGPSPLIQLCQSVPCMGKSSEKQDQEIRSQSEDFIETALREFLTPISRSSADPNDITNDERLPAFVDGEGLFSLVLWRVIVLGFIALAELEDQISIKECISSDVNSGLEELISSIESRLKDMMEIWLERRDDETEEVAERKLVAQTGRESECRLPIRVDEILLSSLRALEHLITKRIERLKVFNEKDLALDLLELKSNSDHSSFLTTAIDYAYSEYSSLSIGLEKVKGLISFWI